MKKEDIKDTIESRKQIVSYLKYLEAGDERVSNEFIIFVAENILSRASLLAMTEALDRIQDKLNPSILSKEAVEEADVKYQLAKEKVFKHCLLLEIEHNHCKKDNAKQEELITKYRKSKIKK